ncbi:hypothetical protein PUR57_07310 [Streptomyces sp. JV176]|uniref:hypothetical protein n=1 Tax=Streptomyces sp. JV176 TaxID=858630 RepID=UPI002E781D88|nr:hypothetical protein [Streptomyces sp. JV176]MEE1798485.1 hypothetical protein [Streptomyces sp. JV176]
MPRPRNVTNRALLTVPGAALVCAGGWALAGNAAVRERLPRGLPAADPGGAVLVGRGALGRAREQGWWTPSVIAVLSLVLLALVWWLLAQARTRQPGVLALPRPGLGLRAGALARAMAEQTERLPGVDRARVRLSGRPRRLLATVDVRLSPGADPSGVVERVTAGVLADARASGAPVRVDARVRFHGPARRGTGYRISGRVRGDGPGRVPSV